MIEPPTGKPPRARIYYDEYVECPRCEAMVRAGDFRPTPEPLPHGANILALAVGGLFGMALTALALNSVALWKCW